MTRLELEQRTLRALNDDPVAPVYSSRTEIQDALQEAQEVLTEEAPLIKRTFTLPRRPGHLVYQLPGVGDQILAPYRVWLPDLKQRLEAKTLTFFDQTYERWLTVTGPPAYWAPLSWDQFLIWPGTGAGEGWLEVNCYCWPTAMVDDGDEPEFPPATHPALVPYATGVGKLKEWDAPGVVERWQAFFGQQGHVRAQASLNQLQERLWSRELSRGDRAR